MVGCFAPIATLSAGSEATLIGSSSILARLIVVAALSSMGLILVRRGRALLITGTVAGLLVLVEFLSCMDELVALPATDPPASAVLSSFTHEWGWALLVGGTALLLLAGLATPRRRRPIR